jgi:hypothetical protein
MNVVNPTRTSVVVEPVSSHAQIVMAKPVIREAKMEMNWLSQRK